MNRLRGKIEDQDPGIFQMYMGWDINGLADVYHDYHFICSSIGIVMEKLPHKKGSKAVC